MEAASWTDVSVYTTPRSILGLQQMWSGDLEAARANPRARACGVRAARHVHPAPGGAVLSGGARMPRRSVGGGRGVRRRRGRDGRGLAWRRARPTSSGSTKRWRRRTSRRRRVASPRDGRARARTGERRRGSMARGTGRPRVPRRRLGARCRARHPRRSSPTWTDIGSRRAGRSHVSWTTSRRIALGRTDEARDVLEPFEAKARAKDVACGHVRPRPMCGRARRRGRRMGCGAARPRRGDRAARPHVATLRDGSHRDGPRDRRTSREAEAGRPHEPEEAVRPRQARLGGCGRRVRVRSSSASSASTTPPPS
jgi:hypothetical protein